MDIEDAQEFYYYNIVGLHAGEQNAVTDPHLIPRDVRNQVVLRVQLPVDRDFKTLTNLHGRRIEKPDPG